MDFFYAACLLGIHHLTLWQRVDDPGRDRGHGRRQVYFAASGRAPVFQRQVRPDKAPPLQIPVRRRQEERL